MGRAAGYKEIPWLICTSTLLYIQLLLTTLTCIYRADFLTLTAVSLAFYQLDNTDTLRRSHFRILVLMIFISIVYDLLWLLLLNNYAKDEIDGGVERTVKRISLGLSWISLFFRVSFDHIHL